LKFISRQSPVDSRLIVKRDKSRQSPVGSELNTMNAADY
jgi:hypothetical protein